MSTPAAPLPVRPVRAWPGRSLLAMALAAGCHAPESASTDAAEDTTAAPGTTTAGTTGDTDAPVTSGESPADTSSTGETPDPDTGEPTSTTTTTTTDDSGADSSSTSDTPPPPPDFDAQPWQTGDDIGYGVSYKDSLDPSAHNVFIGYAGYPFPLDAAQSWATELYHVRLRELGVRHVYAVQGPATVMYSDYEVGNTSIATALQTQAKDASFVLIAGHSSGSYVAHELLGQLEGDWDPEGVTAGKVVYFNLDGGTAGLYAAAVARLRRAYFVSVYDGGTGTAAPNLDAMKYLGDQWPNTGSYFEIDGSASGCNDGAPWCLHMACINSRPHNHAKSDVVDYFDYVDRPVVTTYIDARADEAGLHP